jgi:hypothetical protein
MGIRGRCRGKRPLASLRLRLRTDASHDLCPQRKQRLQRVWLEDLPADALFTLALLFAVGACAWFTHDPFLCCRVPRPVRASFSTASAICSPAE